MGSGEDHVDLPAVVEPAVVRLLAPAGGDRGIAEHLDARLGERPAIRRPQPQLGRAPAKGHVALAVRT
ncbi:hypothetical protein, partial [Metallibacterium scheffleri]|uniref:hypothetical protein n=1 Tax=Metallibacterium scheffleri TaxID=993689 RepID=UPI0023F2AEE9